MAGPVTRPRILTAAELMELEIPEPRWAVTGVIPEGLTIFAGRPKTGKSWMMLATAIAVASGGRALGQIAVAPGDVLYLALEDSPRRLQERVGLQLAGALPPKRLQIAREWARGEAGVADLDEWLRQHPDARLVVIDTWVRFRATSKGRDRGYSDDYADLAPLQKLATQHRVAIVIVHHQRKLDAADWIDTINGTLGVAGAVDAILGLFRVRGELEAELKVTGRDLEDGELGLRFDPDTCTWTLLGDATVTVSLSAERRRILDLLHETGPLPPAEVARRVEANRNTTKHTLQKMARDGQLVVEDGVYGPAVLRGPRGPRVQLRATLATSVAHSDYTGHAGHAGHGDYKGHKGYGPHTYKEGPVERCPACGMPTVSTGEGLICPSCAAAALVDA